jgi:hypothetical protein
MVAAFQGIRYPTEKNSPLKKGEIGGFEFEFGRFLDGMWRELCSELLVHDMRFRKPKRDRGKFSAPGYFTDDFQIFLIGRFIVLS